MKSFKTVEGYISETPPEVRGILKKIRSTIRKAAPKASERISYGMPFYEYGGTGFKGRLAYFAAFRKHISLFIVPGQSSTVPKEMKKYHVSKATYQFPLDKTFPFSVLEKTIKALVRERDNKSANKLTGIAKEVQAYYKKLSTSEQAVCKLLKREIDKNLPKAESKIWHAHPVWFLNGNPIVGFSKQKPGIRLMFWSGVDFSEEGLNVRGGKFKDASVFYKSVNEIKTKDMKRWLMKSKKIQWDYKNLVRRKGKLERVG